MFQATTASCHSTRKRILAGMETVPETTRNVRSKGNFKEVQTAQVEVAAAQGQKSAPQGEKAAPIAVIAAA